MQFLINIEYIISSFNSRFVPLLSASHQNPSTFPLLERKYV